MKFGGTNNKDADNPAINATPAITVDNKKYVLLERHHHRIRLHQEYVAATSAPQLPSKSPTTRVSNMTGVHTLTERLSGNQFNLQ